MVSVLETGLMVAGLYLLYAIYWEVTVGAAHRKFASENGCQPPKVYRDWDPIWNLGFFIENLQGVRRHTVMEDTAKRFAFMGPTFSVKALGLPIINTIEPENIKTVLSLNFKNFHLGNRRKDACMSFYFS